jgi:alkanesulfonate monooxygenase SsuD/methylene tetrahydromethanopterin reductase-like flavin-dependent oxidoreductase (luciferase family)
VTQSGKRPFKVGTFLPLIEDEDTGVQASWPDLLAMAKTAEDVGFDSLWVPDHFLFRGLSDKPGTTGQWEAWSMMCAFAAVTKRVEIGPLVLATSFRNPALLAKMADTLDEISDGRFILGIGAGWHKPEYDAFGFPFDHRFSRFEEALTIVHGLLRNGEIDFNGEYYQARDCELRPRGPRKEGPPILIGTTGEKMLRLTAKYADMTNTAWHYKADAVIPSNEKIDAACAEVGRDPKSLVRTAGVNVDLPGAVTTSSGDGESKAISGSLEEIAETLRTFADHGISHIQAILNPATAAGAEQFAGVLEILDKG